jgi:hypothetical protein
MARREEDGRFPAFVGKRPSSSCEGTTLPEKVAQAARTNAVKRNLGLHRLRGTIRYPEQPFWKQEAA